MTIIGVIKSNIPTHPLSSPDSTSSDLYEFGALNEFLKYKKRAAIIILL